MSLHPHAVGRSGSFPGRREPNRGSSASSKKSGKQRPLSLLQSQSAFVRNADVLKLRTRTLMR